MSLRLALHRSQHVLKRRFLTASASFSSVTNTAEAESLVDERNLLKFDTLASLQQNACQVFADNDLFGTYSEETKQFQWIDYAEFDERVGKVRSVLIDLGTCLQTILLNFDVRHRIASYDP